LKTARDKEIFLQVTFQQPKSYY